MLKMDCLLDQIAKKRAAFENDLGELLTLQVFALDPFFIPPAGSVLRF